MNLNALNLWITTAFLNDLVSEYDFGLCLLAGLLEPVPYVHVVYTDKVTLYPIPI